jgi:hypothetical protein
MSKAATMKTPKTYGEAVAGRLANDKHLMASIDHAISDYEAHRAIPLDRFAEAVEEMIESRRPVALHR